MDNLLNLKKISANSKPKATPTKPLQKPFKLPPRQPETNPEPVKMEEVRQDEPIELRAPTPIHDSDSEFQPILEQPDVSPILKSPKLENQLLQMAPTQIPVIGEQQQTQEQEQPQLQEPPQEQEQQQEQAQEKASPQEQASPKPQPEPKLQRSSPTKNSLQKKVNQWILDKLLNQIKEINTTQKSQFDELQNSKQFVLTNPIKSQKEELTSNINKLMNSSNINQSEIDEPILAKSQPPEQICNQTTVKFKFNNTLSVMQQCIGYNTASKKAILLIRLNDIYKSVQSVYSKYILIRLINYTIGQPYTFLEQKFQLSLPEQFQYFVQNLSTHIGPSQIVNYQDVNIKNFLAVACGFKFIGWNRKQSGIIGQTLVTKQIFQQIDEYLPINPEFSIIDNFNIFSREVIFDGDMVVSQSRADANPLAESTKDEPNMVKSWQDKGIQTMYSDGILSGKPQSKKQKSVSGTLQDAGKFKKSFNVLLQGTPLNKDADDDVPPPSASEIEAPKSIKNNEEALEPPETLGIPEAPQAPEIENVLQDKEVPEMPELSDIPDVPEEPRLQMKKKSKFIEFDLSKVSIELTETQNVVLRQPDQFQKDKAYDLLAVFEKGVRYTIQGNIRVAVVQGLYQRPAKLSIANGRGLQALSLSNCVLESNVDNYDNLRSLSLYQVRGFNPQDLLVMTKLKRLYVNGTNILLMRECYETRLETLYNCRDLEQLYVINSGIKNVLFFDLQMSKLQLLYISEPQIQKLVIDTKLANLNSLQFLFIGEQTTSWSSVNTTDELEGLNTKVAYTIFRTDDKHKTQFHDKKLKNLEFFGRWNLPQLIFLECKNAQIYANMLKHIQ